MPEEDYLKNTVEEERYRVCEIVKRLGPRISGLMITAGFLALAFGIYLVSFPQDPDLSPRLDVIFMAAMAFMGCLNITCGLLLLLGED